MIRERHAPPSAPLDSLGSGGLCTAIDPFTRPGKRLHNYGTSPFLMEKLTISMAIFNSYVSLPEGMIHLCSICNKFHGNLQPGFSRPWNISGQIRKTQPGHSGLPPGQVWRNWRVSIFLKIAGFSKENSEGMSILMGLRHRIYQDTMGITGIFDDFCHVLLWFTPKHGFFLGCLPGMGGRDPCNLEGGRWRDPRASGPD